LPESATCTQTITVSVNVSDPTSADAVAFLVPYSADRNITAPQKRQWCLNGTAGSDYLTTGMTSLTCAVTTLRLLVNSAAHHAAPRNQILCTGCVPCGQAPCVVCVA